MTPRPSAQTWAVAGLSLCTVIWGSTFVLAKGLVTDHDVLSILTLRFATGAVVLTLVRPGTLRGLPRATWLKAAAVGATYGAAQLPHYYGLSTTPAAAAGFLVGTYVVITPLVDLVLFRVRSSLRTVVGVAMALAGLAVFALDGSSFGIGQVLCLVAAVLYALQIASMGAFSPVAGQLWGFTAVVMATITVITGIPALLVGFDPPTEPSQWLVIVYLALVAGAVAVGVQAWAQRRIASSHAAVIMAGEPLWAAALAVLFTAETVTLRLVLGGTLLLAANVLVSLDRA